MDSLGRLTTQAGLSVLDDGGGEIVIDPTRGAVTIGADGTISIQNPGTTTMQTVDKLRLVKAELIPAPEKPAAELDDAA